MSHPSELIDELIKIHLKPYLRERNFRNKSSTFFRQNNDLIEVISPQKDKYNNESKGSFTINLGVYWPKAQEILGRICATFPPKEYDCTLRERLGTLFSAGQNFWWNIVPDSDIQRVGAEVVEKIHNYAMPWFVRATSADEAPRIAHDAEAAVLWALNGERLQAAAAIERALISSKHARPFFRSLAARLELGIRD